jgi:hypothetical protein
VRELALAFQAAQARRTRLTANEVQRLWGQLDRANLSGSWQASVGPRIVRTITAGQLSSAGAADDYVDEVVAAEGADSDRVGRVRPEAFAGIAADGRSLDSLMLLSVITTKQGIAGGLSTDDSMMRGLQQALRLSSSEVTQAGRSAVGSSMVGQRTIQGYVRVVNPPACSRCIILAGREYGWNKGFQRHPRCFPAGVAVSGPRSQAAARRWFEGELVILSTASGQNLPLTGNHPVLTRRGWVPANLLQEGDEVVRSTRPEGATPLVVPDHHEVPSLIEDVWGALSVHGLDRMPTTAEDFHGDGQEGQVDVVYADRALTGGRVAPVGEQLVQFGFASGLGLSGEFAIERAPMLVDLGDSAHAGGAISGSGLGLPFVGAHLLSPDGASLAGAAALDSGLDQASCNHVPGYAVLLPEGELAGSVEVGGDDLLYGEVAGLPRWDAPGATFGVETREGYASRGRDLLERLSSQVELDRVVELRRVEWSGHVYSLTSVEGWHSANSLIVSNCDCVHLPTTLVARHQRRGFIDPESYFNSLSEGEQNRVFGLAGARAIREGADMGQVVNARRGMYTTTAYGRTVQATREGATRRGAFYRQERRRAIDRGLVGPSGRGFQLRTPRLMPEEIFRLADSRDEAIAMLRRFGYLT